MSREWVSATVSIVDSTGLGRLAFGAEDNGIVPPVGGLGEEEKNPVALVVRWLDLVGA
jgi:hypothetical protein